ncbi:MAG TPA: alkaline phosphatase family protein, partial [Gaiellaceae bacterium]|nr:alkaline phosphatase family protein [Gaiellaceae bacterium]
MRRTFFVLAALAVAGAGALGVTGAAAMPAAPAKNPSPGFAKIKHIVVIYEENHSFDNLYGGWEGVNGLSSATAAQSTQV